MQIALHYIVMLFAAHQISPLQLLGSALGSKVVEYHGYQYNEHFHWNCSTRFNGDEKKKFTRLSAQLQTSIVVLYTPSTNNVASMASGQLIKSMFRCDEYDVYGTDLIDVAGIESAKWFIALRRTKVTGSPVSFSRVGSTRDPNCFFRNRGRSGEILLLWIHVSPEPGISVTS